MVSIEIVEEIPVDSRSQLRSALVTVSAVDIPRATVVAAVIAEVDGLTKRLLCPLCNAPFKNYKGIKIHFF